MNSGLYNKRTKFVLLALTALAQPGAHAGISLIANGSLSGTLSDLSGLPDILENGQAANLLGGMGSALEYVGGNTFLGLPDRGPNALNPWNAGVDNTTTYIPRFQTVDLALSQNNGPGLPFNLTPTLTGTTLLFNDTPLLYGPAVPAENTANKFYFSGRSDNFGPGNSLNPSDARFDPEGIRVSNDGAKVFISDEYGPYVYMFDRATGLREKTYTIPPETFAVNTLSPNGATEISGNTTGRVANKGMEGLAITPDGKTLYGFVQSPLIQDGGDGGRANRIVAIDIATGAVKQYAYDNQVGGKNFNSSEILALSDHQFLVLERDGKGLGDNSSAAFKQIWLVDLAGAEDVSQLSGAAALLAKAPAKKLFLDIKAALNAAGITDSQIPAKLEGIAWGPDVMVNGVLEHTLFVANDNDFIPTDAKDHANPNQWFVFGVSDNDILAAVPDSQSSTLALLGVPCAGLMLISLRRKNTNA
jgi:hypothetical protein